MRTKLLIAAAAFAVGAMACGRYHPSTVVMQGEVEDIRALAGSWSGGYSSNESGRAGSISFAVKESADSAFGDVIMVPSAGEALVAADVASGMHQMHAPSATVLEIRFVNATGGEVEGALEPYVAPDCQCTVRTVFHGVVKGDRIDGMYTTYGPNGLTQEGKWSVTRAH
jgi:hypothetical protein